MKAKILLTCALIGALALIMVPGGAFAQEGEVAVTATFSQQELDQMLAPVALYPDSLLAQILIAATYPDQVMEADHWLRANGGLRGVALNDALDRMDWDLSIKALAPFPQVLDMMAQEPDWTQRLGEAFLAQQADVMDSVQRLRRKAEIAGNLRTTSEQRVDVESDYIEIEPVDPEIVYIPRYNPLEVYGPWWWPAYPPFAYYPVWPGVIVAPVGVFGFWGGITVGPVWGWGWGSWGWGTGNVFLNVNRNVNINTTNVTVVRNLQSNIQVASMHRLAVAGRLGSPVIRARALGTRVANPAVLRGHISHAVVANGRLQPPAGRGTATGGALGRGRVSPGLTGRGFGRTAPGTRTGRTGISSGRTGVSGRSFGGRPSAASVMQGLRGGRNGTTGSRTGAAGRGYGRTAPGARTGRTGIGSARTGASGRSFGGRPSASSVMQGLRGGRSGTMGSRTGAAGRGYGRTAEGARAGRSVTSGSSRTQGSFGQRNSYRGETASGGGRGRTSGSANRSAFQGRGTGSRAGGMSHAAFNGRSSGRSYGGGMRNVGRPVGGQFHNAGAPRGAAPRPSGGGGRGNAKQRK